MLNWSASTGANIVARFEKNESKPTARQKEQRYRAKAKGVDRRGDQLWNEFLILKLFPTASNFGFTTACVAPAGGGMPLTLRIYHNTRYLTPDTTLSPEAS